MSLERLVKAAILSPVVTAPTETERHPADAPLSSDVVLTGDRPTGRVLADVRRAFALDA